MSTDPPPWTTSKGFDAFCRHAVSQAEALRGRIKAREPGRSTAATLGLYNAFGIVLDQGMGQSSLMKSVHPDAGVRKSAEACEQDLARLANEVSLDREVYEILAALDLGEANAQTRRFVEKALRQFRRSGVDRDDATRDELRRIHEEMVELGQGFERNVRQDIRSIAVEPGDLQGLPADWIEAHPPGDDGKVKVTTDYPDFFPFETYVGRSKLRQALYEAFLSRGVPENGAILAKLLALRYRYATLLGYPTWAAYMAEDKMVKTAGAIDDFIAQLTRITRPRSDADLTELLERKRQDEAGAEAIEVWDRFYYVAKVREEKHDFDARAVRPYFSYPAVKQGIFDLYAGLFGLRFELSPDAPVWHPSVEAYDVLQGEDVVGRFYLDMHPRANKYKHAAMFPIQTGLAGGQIPMASLVCNFPSPTSGDGKALMEHNQVVTFFHEFGHLVHHLLARRSKWITLGGINVEWDFVEAPSQILEEWSWDPKVLQRFARHVDTGQPIPADLVRRMRAAEEFGKGVHVMRQIFYTAYSFYLHDRNPKDLDLDAFTDDAYRRYSPYPAPRTGRVYGNFGHLVGYSSMYYTYQWSLVIAKDLFTRFTAEGLLNPKVAGDYRRTILEPGGMEDAADLVHAFLGRSYNLDAYRRWLERR